MKRRSETADKDKSLNRFASVSEAERLESRSRRLNQAPAGNGPVVYWMNRDQRARDNWAMLFAREHARQRSTSLGVVFALPHRLPARQFEFLIEGLSQTGRDLEKLRIPLHVLSDDSPDLLVRFLRGHAIGLLVTDFSPLREDRRAIEWVAQNVGVETWQVDAHNVVHCWMASPKQEYAAYTFRPRITRLLPIYMKEFPRLRANSVTWQGSVPAIDWAALRKSSPGDSRLRVRIPAGPAAAERALRSFLADGLPRYHDERNDPTKDAQSGLSAYLHFGQISAQRVALAVQMRDEHIESQEAFLEELIVRRELSDNFCYYNGRYDSLDGCPDWARRSLDEHRADPREFLYDLEKLEAAATHDELWNAAQTELLATGKMHGYMRMYWAKKILEWSVTPEEALAAAIHLNDTYSLDGNDPNGLAGVAWSIGGVHDRPWFERDVFGKVRFMSSSGCARKFDVRAYIAAQSACREEVAR